MKPIEYYELILDALYEATFDLNRIADKLDKRNDDNELKAYMDRIADLSMSMAYSCLTLTTYIKNRKKE